MTTHLQELGCGRLGAQAAGLATAYLLGSSVVDDAERRVSSPPPKKHAPTASDDRMRVADEPPPNTTDDDSNWPASSSMATPSPRTAARSSSSSGSAASRAIARSSQMICGRRATRCPPCPRTRGGCARFGGWTCAGPPSSTRIWRCVRPLSIVHQSRIFSVVEHCLLWIVVLTCNILNVVTQALVGALTLGTAPHLTALILCTKRAYR